MKRSLRSWLWRLPVEQEVDEELSFHAEMRRREHGGGDIDARELARVRRTCVDIARRRDRVMRMTQWFDEVRLDVRLAIRQLRAAPGFVLVAAVTLALGIGANSAMFALADAVLLRPLPFRDADRLVIVEERGAAHEGPLRSRIAPLHVRDWSEQNRTFEVLAAAYLSPGGGGPAVTGADGTPEIVPDQLVTARFFDVLGVRPILGRTFVPDDDAPTGEVVVVLSETLWRSHFGADPAVVGRTLLFDGRPRRIVGVAPAGFQYFRPTGMWTILRRDQGRRLFAGLRVVGRLKSGVTIDAARADLNRIADTLAKAFPDDRLGRRVTVEPFRAELIGPELRLTSLLFLGIVGCVLLMCCANVANLLLGRAAMRARELAVRSSLGAGRGRVVRQLVTESLVLSALGGILGAGAGAAVLTMAPSFLPPRLLPGGVVPAFDGRVATFCALAALAVGIVFGLAPAWHATGGAPASQLAADPRTSTARGAGIRGALVAAQTAVAVVLLCGAGLLIRTLLVLDGFEGGYGARSDLLLTMDFALSRGAGSARLRSDALRMGFYDAVQREVEAVPGVRRAAWATTLALGQSQTGTQTFAIVGDPEVPESERPRANYQIVSPSYFATVDLPIVAGRAFTDRDTGVSGPVCIVSEAFARRYLAGRSPIGIRVAVDKFTRNEVPEREIVGVARQVKGEATETDDLAQVYVPLSQDVWQESYLIVRIREGFVEASTPGVRAAIARVDRDMPVRSIMTLDRVETEMTERYRFRAALVSAFAGLALVLAMLGVFGVLVSSVQRRRRELGVRLALGATAASLFGLVLRQAGGMVAVGAAAGLGLAVLLVRSISTFLFGVQPLDPVTFAAVGLVVLVTAAAAAAAPAWRATRVDPVVAFRQE